MVNGIQEKGMNKDSNMIIKIRKYPGASSTDILDHIKPSLRKDPDQILIHAGTNDLTNDQNYLKNVKKIVKLVRETCKDTKLCFSFEEILNHHAPIKQTKVRGNTKPHINKAHRKEIMKRSRLKNKANKSGKEDDKRLYKIQRNKVTKLNNKLKKTYFKQKLPKGNNVKDFCNYCKPYFTNKGICNDDRIILVEKNEILNKDSDISETFNKYFVNITKDLGIFDWGNGSFDHLNIFQRISDFENHPSIQLIKNKYQNTFKFKFKPVTTEQIITFIDEIDCNKSSSGEIPAKIIKMAKEEVSEPITNCINDSIISDIFPGELKLADIVPTFKKEDQNDKAIDQLAFYL